jgi:type IV pilus assembly protein PilN
MIKINLLPSDRPQVRKRIPIQLGQKLTVVCGAILVTTAAGIGWRFWSLRSESAQLDVDIAAAQQETQRLHSVIAQVQQFEQRKAQLQQRVQLIEQLRTDQTGPVHMLDQISRSMPPMLWLTELEQGANPNEVVVQGRCATLTGLSDFVVNLESSGYFKRSVEIVSTEAEFNKAAGGEIIRFSIKAQFQLPGQAGKAAESAPATKKPARAAAKHEHGN